MVKDCFCICSRGNLSVLHSMNPLTIWLDLSVSTCFKICRASIGQIPAPNISRHCDCWAHRIAKYEACRQTVRMGRVFARQYQWEQGPSRHILQVIFCKERQQGNVFACFTPNSNPFSLLMPLIFLTLESHHPTVSLQNDGHQMQHNQIQARLISFLHIHIQEEWVTFIKCMKMFL